MQSHNFKNLCPQPSGMVMDVIKKVRLSDEQAALLARLAKSTNSTESSILREGLRLVERMRMRQENIHQLLDLSDIGADSYVKWEGKA
jgi:predicted transcriptional regulator